MEKPFARSPATAIRQRLGFAQWLLLGALCVTGLKVSAQKTSSPLAKPEVESHSWWSSTVDQALERSEKNHGELLLALKEVPVDQRKGLEFLLENMPGEDLKHVSGAFLIRNLAAAYETKKEMPWGKSVPEEIFLNEVLPYVNIDEKREDWRRLLHDQCAPLVVDCKTAAAAAQRLNEKIFPLFKVKYSTKRKKANQSPSESISTGLASCTGLSILLIDACRSVGVPARLAGIPNWIDNRGNHTWVEIWDGRWHFTGAAEPSADGLDHTWFQGDAALAVKDSKEHAIYAASYRKTGLPFPLVWAPGMDYVNAVNVTDNYTKTRKPEVANSTRLMIKVMDRIGGTRVAAQVTVSDVADQAFHFEGISHDEKVDLNDLLSTPAIPGHKYKIHASLGDLKADQDFECKNNQQELVVLFLGGKAPEATPAVRSTNAPAKRASTGLDQALLAYFTAPPEKQRAWKFEDVLQNQLRMDEATVRQAAWAAYQQSPIHDKMRQDFGSNQVKSPTHLSPYTVKKVGQRPANGWPLFIAMHGGGGVPKEINDSQWRDMQRYYRDQTNVTGYLYVALRAPNDTWNGFYDDYMYPLIDNLTRQFRLFGDIDPNKVFIMGYSHGGYGVFSIGPKMPDHFAAIHASASAPNGADTSAKTLRTTPFAFMVGEKDTSYGRIDRCREFDVLVKKLRGDRTDIYPVTFEYQPGYGHGGLPDRNKIEDLYPYVRNPVPAEISWEMTDSVIHELFWIEVPVPGRGQEVDVVCRDNKIIATTTNVTAANIFLDKRLVDYNRPLTLIVNGQNYSRKLVPSLEVLCETLQQRGDPDLAFTARLHLPL